VDPLSEVAQPLSEVVTLGPATEIRGEVSGRARTGGFPWRTWTQLRHAALQRISSRANSKQA